MPGRYVPRLHGYEAAQWTPDLPETVGPVLSWLVEEGMNPAFLDGMGGAAVLLIGHPMDGQERLRCHPGQWVISDLGNGLVTVLDAADFHHHYQLQED